MQDITTFQEKETAGLMSVVRLTEDSLAFSTKNFDSATGEELAETVVGGSIQEYKDKVAELQAQIKELNTFIAKCESLEVQN